MGSFSLRAFGTPPFHPEEILTKKVLAEPHRTFISGQEREQIESQELRYALKKAITKELLKANQKNSINSHLEYGSPGYVTYLV